MWCQICGANMCGATICGARIPLKLEVTEVKRSRSNDGRHLGIVAPNSHIYMASLVVKVIYTLIDYPVWCQDW